MCDRFALPERIAAEHEFMPAQAWWNFQQRFNVAAHQYVPAIRLHDGQSEAVMLRWGLIPAWAEGVPTSDPELCVNAEAITESEVYRAAWLNGQRCILPVAGFYLWQLTSLKYRQPYFVRVADRSVFGLAAVWDRSVTEEDDVIESCSVICVPPNALVAEIANTEHRMPAILRRKDYETWLRGTPVEAKETLQSYNPQWMQAYAVSPRVNSPTADDAGLIRPVYRSAH